MPAWLLQRRLRWIVIQHLTRERGTSVFKFLDFSSRFNSGTTYTETSAVAGGAVIGFTVPSNTFARMTEEHQATVVVTKN